MLAAHTLGRQRFDLLVVGGGIYGAWAAYDAALRGLSVALLEKDDWAAGTSSASSKLIHGGLRYLETLELRLVRHSLHERSELLRLMPHQVRPLEFVVPLHPRGRFGRLRLQAGLILYDLLAGRRRAVPRHRRLDAQAARAATAVLAQDGLRGAFSYHDAAEDDARMVVEIVDGARRAGAAAFNGTRVLRLRDDGARVLGAVIEAGGRSIEVEARVTLLCAGPWSADLLPDRLGHRSRFRCTKGVHLVFPGLGLDHAFLLTVPEDGRVFFMIPWHGRTLVGTTDTDYPGDPDALRVDATDVNYLLRAVNGWLARPFDRDSVVGAFAGVRTLKASRTASPSRATREWKLRCPAPGLLLPIGGKYTSARADAGRAIDRVQRLLGRAVTSSPTASGDSPWAPEPPFSDWLDSMQRAGQTLGLDPVVARTLAGRQGARVGQVLARIGDDGGLAERVHPELPFCLAEVAHAVEHEMARSLGDVLRRRMPASILARVERGWVETAARVAARSGGWDAARVEQETTAVLDEGRELLEALGA